MTKFIVKRRVNSMEIIITKHAIKRYRERLFDYNSTDKVITDILIDVVKKGRFLNFKPCNKGQCMEVKYRGISVVLQYSEGQNATVLTCLGDTSYRKWIKLQGVTRLGGRLLYPGKTINCGQG